MRAAFNNSSTLQCSTRCECSQSRAVRASEAVEVTAADDHSAVEQPVDVHHPTFLVSRPTSYNNGGMQSSVCDAALLTTSPSPVPTPFRRPGRGNKRPGAGAAPMTQGVERARVQLPRTQRAITQ